VSAETLADEEKVFIYPAQHYVMPGDRIESALEGIKAELKERLQQFQQEGKLLEAQRLQARGAARVIVSAELEGTGRPLEKAQWAAAIDSVGGAQLSWLVRSMQNRGLIASLGNAGGNDLATSVLPFILRGVRLIGVNVMVYIDLKRHLWGRLATDLKPAGLQENTRMITLDELPARMQAMLEGRSDGRAMVDFGR